MQINSQTLSLLTQAVTASFMQGLSHKSAPWDVVAMEIPSSTAENVYPYLRELGSIRKWVGDRVIQNLSKGDFKLRNEPYEETHGIKRTQIEDDQYGVYSRMFEQVGRNVATFPSKMIYSHLAQGFTTLGPDGQYFFDTDHPVGLPGAEASVSNFMGGSGDAWYLVDASQVLKPMIWQPRKSFNLVTLFDETDPKVFWAGEYVYGVDGRAGYGFSPFWQLAFASKQPLTKENVKATATAMRSQRSDAGEPLAVMPTHLVVGPSLGETAMDLMSQALIVGGESNTLRNRFTVVESPWLL